MLAKRIIALATVATLGVTTAALAGEGSSDIDRNSWASGTIYSYPSTGYVVTEPSYRYGPGVTYERELGTVYEQDLNTGFSDRRVIEEDDDDFVN